MTTQIEVTPINEKFFAKTGIDSKRRPCAQLWQNTPKGKRADTKCLKYYCFRSEAERDRWVLQTANEIFETIRKTTERAAKNLQAKKEAIESGTVKVGSIFCFSWGYDQTNIDFFQVVEVKGSSVVVREIAAESELEDRGDCGKKMPIANFFIGEPMTKRIKSICGYISIKMASYGSCTLWDGSPKFFSTYA